MNILKARAWCTLDKPLLKFESYVDDCGVAWFRMCQDHDVKYNFGVPFIDDDWIVEWWTGKVDKNNVDIYSGDLIKHGLFAFNDTVKFGKECWNNLPDGVDENDISTIIESPIEVLAQTSSEFRGYDGFARARACC